MGEEADAGANVLPLSLCSLVLHKVDEPKLNKKYKSLVHVHAKGCWQALDEEKQGDARRRQALAAHT